MLDDLSFENEEIKMYILQLHYRIKLFSLNPQPSLFYNNIIAIYFLIITIKI